MLTRSTFQWLVILLLSAVAVAGLGGYYVWQNSDLLLRRGIETKLAEIAPEWDIAFRHVHFDGEGGIRLVDVAVAAPGQPPIVEIPEIHVALDRELFTSHHRVIIQKVVVLNPVATVIRHADGKWNFQHFAPLKPSEAALPEIRILNGDLLLRQEPSDLTPLVEVGCHHLDASLVPSANRQYQLYGKTEVDHTGELELEGGVDLRSGRWKIAGKAPKVDIRDGLMDVAMDVSPDVRQRLQALARPVRQLNNHNLIRVAATSEAEAESPVSLLPELGIEAQLDVAFQIGMSDRLAPLKYDVKVGIDRGKILDLLPIPLFDLRGVVQIDEKGVKIDELTAANGVSRVFVDGDVKYARDGGAKEFTIQATNLQIDGRIREHLPAHLQRLYDSLRPQGRFNVDIEVRQEPEQPPTVTLRRFTVIEGAIEHELFRYPATGISGTIKQEDGAFVLDMIGFAGDRPCNCTGTVRNLGPDMEVDIRVHAAGIPLDEQFLNAFQVEKQQPVRKALTMLNLRGIGDADARFLRSPATDRKFKMQLQARVRGGGLRFEKFPLDLSDLSGELHYDSLEEDVWKFVNFKAHHRGTPVRGHGSYVVAAPGLLTLGIDADGLPINQDLRDAVDVATPHLDPLFDHLQPQGRFDIHEGTVTWSPGGEVRVDFPSIALNDGRLKISAFPYQWERVSATGRWEHDSRKLTIDALLAWHGETYLQIDGKGEGAQSFVLAKPREDVLWRAHFDKMFVGKMVSDVDLLRALPGPLLSIVQAAEVRGAVDLEGSVDMKQFADEAGTLTAQWRSRLSLVGNDVYAGIPLKGVRGAVQTVSGTWDGQKATIDGFFEIERARAYGLPVENVAGPYSVDGNLVTVGHPSSAPPNRPENRYAGQSVEGLLYGGKIGADAQARIGETTDKTVYGAVLTIRNAALERWAFDNGKREKLRGPVNGVVNLSGRGDSPMGLTGSGWMQLTNAQLYDLPVLVQVFTKMDFANTDSTAFHYAYSDFRIHHGLLDFSDIELVGDAVKLAGKGYVGFAGERARVLELDFTSAVTNKIPIIGPLITGGKKGWVGVKVVGTVDTPQAYIQPRPIFDDALGGFMRAVDAGNWRPRAAPQPVNPFPLAQ
ncbi:AsmA-like C-terminal domain-containing protein [Planctomyces sp. SH-PL14]|uniref:AsmA-like C-terminal domain-containing protein n=1 Tax=Planctomyces sp. SH-PL14 TaxID=1632864 RepID=UPI00078CECB0|nr:AsmA-like C-terminal domain-containing protein [Planctomyces sp. SH-PL14]AMV20961.1 hypothetical protein VT03_23870 [Planctomyces sp. SH-PL14]